MPYPRTRPATVKELFKSDHEGHHTICQNNRDLYRKIEALEISQDIKDELLLMVRLNYAFGKRMHEKLKGYRYQYDTAEKDRHYEEEI